MVRRLKVRGKERGNSVRLSLLLMAATFVFLTIVQQVAMTQIVSECMSAGPGDAMETTQQ